MPALSRRQLFGLAGLSALSIDLPRAGGQDGQEVPFLYRQHAFFAEEITALAYRPDNIR